MSSTDDGRGGWAEALERLADTARIGRAYGRDITALERDSADIAGAIADGEDRIEEVHIVTIRWQMMHAHELRQIRESLARLEAALVDAKATGAEK